MSLLASSWHRAQEVGFRWAALGGLICATYIVAGSWFFPSWWYGFFWDSGYRRIGYIKEAIFVLLDGYFWLVLGILLGFFVLVISVVVWGQWVFPTIGKWAGLLIFGSIMVIVTDAVILFHTQREPYVRMAAAFQNVREAVQKAGAALLAPGINPPFDFYYLDRSGIEALYSQIEPELQEQQRVIKGTGTVKAGAGVAIGETGLKVQARKSTASESVYAHSDFSPERKCIEIMKYVRQTWTGNYYTTFPDWLATQLYMQLGSQFERALNPAAGPPGTARTPPVANSVAPADAWKQAVLEREKWEGTLKGQLQLLQGLVFIDGDFRVSKSNAGDFLVENFMQRPFRVSFRVFVPHQAFKSLPNSQSSMRLRVFGNVTTPLNKDGLVSVKALAIF